MMHEPAASTSTLLLLALYVGLFAIGVPSAQRLDVVSPLLKKLVIAADASPTSSCSSPLSTLAAQPASRAMKGMTAIRVLFMAGLSPRAQERRGASRCWGRLTRAGARRGAVRVRI